MNKEGKIILGIGAAAALFFIANKVFNLSLFDKKVNVTVKKSSKNPDIIDFSKLRIPFNLVFDNPVNHTYKISQPFVRLYDNGNLLGTTDLSTLIYEIPANSTKELPIEFIIPVTKVISSIADIKNYIDGFVKTGKIVPIGKSLKVDVQVSIDGINLNTQYNYSI